MIKEKILSTAGGPVARTKGAIAKSAREHAQDAVIATLRKENKALKAAVRSK
jgi:hypothetical protein